MIRRLIRRLRCDHNTVKSEEYDLLANTSYWDNRGEYRPYYEGVEHVCRDCGKTWCTDVTGYRYYMDCERNLIEKVEREP